MAVAIVSDTCHYLPRELLAAARHPRGQPLRPLGRSQAQRESDITDYDHYYERLRDDGRPADDLAAVDRRLPRGLRAAARCRQRHRLDPPRRRDVGHRAAPPSRRASSSAPEPTGCTCVDSATACGGEGLVVLAAAARGPRRRRAAAVAEQRAARPRAAEDVVRDRDARVPAPRRTDRRRAGMARLGAEDQADPDRRIGDHAGRAGAHLEARVRADGRPAAVAARRTAPTPGWSSTSRPRARPRSWSAARNRDIRLRAEGRSPRSAR